MVEERSESSVNRPRAEVVKKVEVNGRNLVVLKASPRSRELGARPEGGPPPAPVLFVEGHNPKPKKDDGQVKTGHDMSVLADSMGCDVYSVVRSSEGSDSARLVKGEDSPEGVAITQLHRAKAEEILGAIERLQEERELTRNPLDVMGFSDGGIVTMAMLDARPDLFGRFVITNTPGLDNTSTSRSYAKGFREIGHLAAHKMLQRMGRYGKEYSSQSKLTFQRDSEDGYADSSYMGNPRLETQAVARARSLLRLLPNILARNPNIQGYIVNTEKDRISPADKVQKELESVVHDARIQAKRTGWKAHTMGYGSQERPEKLSEQGNMMLELRGKQ